MRIKMILAVIITAILLCGCGQVEENTSFTGIITAINGDNFTVTTTDKVGFEEANVALSDDVVLDFTPQAGQTVNLTILPQIAETYPVQVTAVQIQLKEVDTMNATYTKITPKEAKEIMENEDVIILDVRAQSEFDSERIDGAILIPDNEIEDDADEKLTDKSAKILVYCRSGRRSEAASKLLVELGYENVYDFGGILDWPYDTITGK